MPHISLAFVFKEGKGCHYIWFVHLTKVHFPFHANNNIVKTEKCLSVCTYRVSRDIFYYDFELITSLWREEGGHFFTSSESLPKRKFVSVIDKL